MIHTEEGCGSKKCGSVEPTPFDFRTSQNPCISNCFQPSVTPLPKLALGPGDQLEALLQSASGRGGDVDPNWTTAEREVVELLGQQRAVVKTIKNTEWTSFLHRFQIPKAHQESCLPLHRDKAPYEGHPFNSFLTSCSLLPPYGQKMRAYGSPNTFTAGVVFALPERHYSGDDNAILEGEAAEETRTYFCSFGNKGETRSFSIPTIDENMAWHS